MNLVWLQSGGCGGCTLSWLGSELGPLFATLADEGLEILCTAAGDGALSIGDTPVLAKDAKAMPSSD